MLLLDVLEHFELHKLCLIVCNRYQLAQKLGRYVVSIASKFSNMQNVHCKFDLLRDGYSKQIQQQTSFVAHQTLHTAFEMINPAYLVLKRQGESVTETNSLGHYCYRGLHALGYWKKLIYIMDVRNSLRLARSYRDYHSYKTVFLMNYSDKSEALVSLLAMRTDF